MLSAHDNAHSLRPLFYVKNSRQYLQFYFITFLSKKLNSLRVLFTLFTYKKGGLNEYAINP
jgi:hypothetical protein